MLSRVAERLYWLGRYMERAENTARLVNTYSYLLMDLPRGATVGWDTVIEICGITEQFNEQYERADERNVTRYMLAQHLNPSSIISSLFMARENARTSREVMPTEAWELVNDLFLWVKDNTSRSASRSGRNGLLLKIINSSQQFAGLLGSCMSHNSVYDFLMIGCNIERADMTTRIIDVGTAELYSGDTDKPLPFGNILWMNVLRSLSAYQMYRQHVQNRISGRDVVEFLVKDEDFPRTVLHCLNRLDDAVRGLPNNDECLRVLATTRRRVQEAELPEILERGQLFEYVDKLQLDIAAIHDAVTSNWFLPVAAEAQPGI